MVPEIKVDTMQKADEDGVSRLLPGPEEGTAVKVKSKKTIVEELDKVEPSFITSSHL